jgi:hypothetical protein
MCTFSRNVCVCIHSCFGEFFAMTFEEGTDVQNTSQLSSCPERLEYEP